MTFLVGFCIIILLYWLFAKYGKDVNYTQLWVRYQHFVYSLVILIIAYFVITELILYFEEVHFYETGKKSQIMKMKNGDFHRWILILIMMGYEEEIFPLSQGAQFLTASVVYLGWIALGCSILFEHLFNLKRKRRMEGKQAIKHVDHYVVCGWNVRTSEFISNALESISGFTHKKAQITLINEDLSEVLEGDAVLSNLIEFGRVDYIQGRTRDKHILERANVDKASSVILFADGDTIESDEKTLLRAMAISRYCRAKNKNALKDSIYMIAEVNDLDFKESLMDADVNEVICTKCIGNNIITQSMISRGVSTVLQDLLMFNDETNEFYNMDLRKHKSLVNKNFDELHSILRKHNVLLIGIKSVFYDEDGVEIIDRHAIAEALAEDPRGITNQYIINPASEIERNFKTDDDDQLIVLCRNGKILQSIP